MRYLAAFQRLTQVLPEIVVAACAAGIGLFGGGPGATRVAAALAILFLGIGATIAGRAVIAWMWTKQRGTVLVQLAEGVCFVAIGWTYDGTDRLIGLRIAGFVVLTLVVGASLWRRRPVT